MSRFVALWLVLWPGAAGALLPLEIEYEVLQPSVDVTPRQDFGWSVARAPGLVVVGAPHDQQNAPNAGAGYAFERDGDVWRESKLIPIDGADGDRAGIGVAIAGQRAVLASYHNDERGPDSGAVYVFRPEKGGWVQEAKLVGSDLDESDFLGIAVDAEGDEILAGASYGGNQRQVPGTVYAFRRDGTDWYETQKFTAADAQVGDHFGSGLAMSGDTAVVRSNGSFGSFKRGVSYVFRRGEGGWVEEAKLVPEPGGSGFSSVAVHGDRIVVGASEERVHTAGAVGAAHVYGFDGSGWVKQASLFASDGVDGDRFGDYVAIWRDLVLVRARVDATPGNRSGNGVLYVFRFDGAGWVEVAKLLPPADDGSFGLRTRFEDGLVVTGGGGRAHVIDLRERVNVDIAPWRDSNRIDPLSRLAIFVAVLGAEGFEAGAILPESLRFGPAGARPLARPAALRLDVDRDGHRDLVSRYAARDTGIAFGDSEACLEGRRENGLAFRGCDTIETVPRCGGGVEMALLIPTILWLARRRPPRPEPVRHALRVSR